MKRIYVPIIAIGIAVAAAGIATPLANAADDGQQKAATPVAGEPRKGEEKAAAPTDADTPKPGPEPDKASAGKRKTGAKERVRISEEEARKSALASVPDSTVRRAYTTVYFGKPVWSIDLKREKSTRLMNVQIDAYSGRIVSKRLLPPGAVGREKPPTKADVAP